MIRTQIQLNEEQARRLKELARERGVSMAEMVRQAVDQIVANYESDKWSRASALVGRYRTGLDDVSARHDDYLAEDFR